MTGAPDWAARDAEVCWHPYTQHGLPDETLAVVRAEGAWLELADGRRLLDAISSWWCCLHGHGHPRLVAALERQARTLDHVLFAGCTHEPAVRLAEQLLAVAPPGLARVFYSDDGSTAVEVALKLAYQTWVRRKEPARTIFLALEGGYHGDTFGAMAASDPEPFFREFSPFLFHVVRIPPHAAALDAAFQAHRGRVAGMIVEPLVQGAAGMRMQSPEFLRSVRACCDAHDAFLIADEVMTGFGRTGALFACELADVRPDLLCVAKGLTGGMLPLAATLATAEIFAAFQSEVRAEAFFHGHTFTANALGCAVALESLALLRDSDVPARFGALGERIERGLESLRAHPGVAELRRLGGIVAVELADAGNAGYLSDLAPRLRAACRGGEVLLRPLGNVLYAMPPACTSDAESDRIAAAMLQACRNVLDAATPAPPRTHG
ncbi:MAG TPA: adenosylmethionine--8-amino-7-oxononanoate transaminase [Planctomycetota bacterium]